MLISILVNFVPIIIAIVLHEVAHGYAACWCGDNTAKQHKRLSLNPLRHIDVFGTLILPAILLLAKTGFIFGWARPVPVNYANLRHPKRDILLVASAGIITNLLLALVSAQLIRRRVRNRLAVVLCVISSLLLLVYMVISLSVALLKLLLVAVGLYMAYRIHRARSEFIS